MISAKAATSGAGFARAFTAAIALVSCVAACTHEGDSSRPLVFESRTVGFSREDPLQTTHGKLRFRGGLELRSGDDDFGGLSALLVSADGRDFITVTDQGHWVTGTLEYEDGNLSSAKGGWIAPMLDMDGQPLLEKAGDAEGMASAVDGSHADDLFVSFEGDHRVWRYPFGRDGVRAMPVELALPPEALKAPRNGGLEGVTRLGDGLLFAVSERYRDRSGNYRAWTLSFPPLAGAHQGPGTATAATLASAVATPRALSVHPMPPYSMTDVRELPDGDLLTLERRYNPVDGVGVQMRRIPSAVLRRAIESGTELPLDGELIVSFDDDYEIDNMEGLSLRTGESGETLVYMISDDNFNRPMQRTLLLMFELLR